MTITTIFADAVDDYISSDDSGASASYTKARAGTGTSQTVANDGTLYAGQFGSTGALFQVYEAFMSFDTSALAGQYIQSVVLSLYGVDDSSVQDFTIEIWLKDWGASVTSADFVAGASLAAQTRLASFATSGMATSAYNDFTSDATFVNNINTGGTTRVMAASSRTNSGTTPVTGTLEYAGFSSADTAGTTQDPKLTVTHFAIAGPHTRGGRLLNGGVHIGGRLVGR